MIPQASRTLAALLMLTLGAHVAHSQTAAGPVTLLSDDPDLHIVQKTDPVYPPIAKAAHVSGSVKLRVDIDERGDVASTKIVSGPPMLQGAAQDAVRSWVYQPVSRAGAPVRVATEVTVSFTLPAPKNPNDEKIASEFFPLQNACRQSFSAKEPTEATAKACGKAAEVASQFSTEERFIERRSAFVYASTAYLRNKQLTEALSFANKATEVVAQGHDDGSGSCAAYSVRAQAEAASGDLPAASDDLTKAEDFERLGIRQLADAPELVKHEYVPTLRNLLNFHAQVLVAMGKPHDADQKTAEAAKL